jgi:hypothetical protein
MCQFLEKICMQTASRISKVYSLLGAEVNYLVYGAQIEVTAWIAILTSLSFILCKCGSSSFWIPVVKQTLSSVWSWIYPEFSWWDLINRILFLAHINMERFILWLFSENHCSLQNVAINISKHNGDAGRICPFSKCANWYINHLPLLN